MHSLQSQPWDAKRPTAVFRGAVRVSASLGPNEFDSRCDDVGRTGLWRRAQDHVAATERDNRREGLRRGTWPFFVGGGGGRGPILDVRVAGVCGGKVYVSDNVDLVGQLGYRFVVHAAGNSFWADRLLGLLWGGVVVVKQETPCGMFFEPLLRPYLEYLPVDFRFIHLVRQILWARQNEDAARGIATRARKFAEEYLSIAGVQAYSDAILTHYAAVVQNGTTTPLAYGAVQIF